MIYDRDYMQPEHDPRDAAVARPLILAIVFGFIVQAIFTTFVPQGAAFLFDNAYLSLPAILGFKVWTILTYPLLEAGVSPWSVIAVVFNAIMLHLFARTLVPIIGRRGFWTVVIGAAMVGGLLTLATALARPGLPGVAVGASALVLALLTVFACLQPDRPISFLLAFVIPVTIKPKYLAWFLAGLAVFGLIFFELQGRPGATPPSNLLGGMLAGWLYHRFVHRPGAVFQSSGPAIEMPAWMKRKKKVAVAASAKNFTVNVTPASPADIRAEVDRILDKINSKGFGSLTVEERRILDEARDTLNKR
ncbi:MAG: rhomboid family intramembrane serine protease [Opitutaceae bacterium]|nr:rhomboid family intramembrane serine protease [Opitutaceae bacterium]